MPNTSHRPALYTQTQLEPYRRFRTIFLEMTHAKNFPKVPFRFLDLPKEIRLSIYEILLELENPVELWHESSESLSSRASDRTKELRSVQHRIHRRKIPVCLLRTCKLIYQEAVTVWYGKNDFRFPGINGTSVACAFLDTVKLRNYRWLKCITLPMPFWSEPRRYIYALEANVDSLTSSTTVMRATPWNVRIRKHDDPRDLRRYELAAARVLRSLVNTELQVLNLVLPDWYEYREDGRGQNKIWEAIKQLFARKPELKPVVVYLQTGEGESESETLTAANKTLLTKLATSLEPLRPWYMRDAVFDARGRVDAAECYKYLA